MQKEFEQLNDYVALSAEIVAAYVSHNRISRAELPDLITSVHRSIASLGAPTVAAAEQLQRRVPIRKTVTPDYLISLEDGKQYRSLKRHLSTMGLTPDAYRTKWGLPHDYPMTAPNYSKQRSELAKRLGLGQVRGKGRPGAITAVGAAPAKPRGRPRKQTET
jgi:predicted transcriptional regulator